MSQLSRRPSIRYLASDDKMPLAEDVKSLSDQFDDAEQAHVVEPVEPETPVQSKILRVYGVGEIAPSRLTEAGGQGALGNDAEAGR